LQSEAMRRWEALFRFLALRPGDALALCLVCVAALAVEGIRWLRRPDPELAAALVASDSLFQARWRAVVETAAQFPDTVRDGLRFRSSAGRGSAPLRLIPINRATAAQLEQLPGIGPKLARAIVAYREQHGPFRHPEDLLRIRGIGPKKLAQIRDRITLE
jgi:comEA protein